jgi:hypothetical protein
MKGSCEHRLRWLVMPATYQSRKTLPTAKTRIAYCGLIARSAACARNKGGAGQKRGAAPKSTFRDQKI